MMKVFWAIAAGLVFLVGFDGKSNAKSHQSIEDIEQESLKKIAAYLVYHSPQENRQQEDSSFESMLIPKPGDDLEDAFPEDRQNKPIRYDGKTPIPIPGLGSRTGAPEIIAMKVFEQTLAFFGTKAAIRKNERKLEFIILESKFGYFEDLTALDVAFAIRQFSRYLTAHLCGDASIKNFYEAFAQIPAERMGFRFKYDMAWALLGNSLPRRPNQVLLLGDQWNTVNDMIRNTDRMTGSKNIDRRELDNFINLFSEIINFVENMNKLVCFIDLRPDPELELQKRIVIKKLLDLKIGMNDRYEKFQEIIEKAQEAGEEQKEKALLSN